MGINVDSTGDGVQSFVAFSRNLNEQKSPVENLNVMTLGAIRKTRNAISTFTYCYKPTKQTVTVCFKVEVSIRRKKLVFIPFNV